MARYIDVEPLEDKLKEHIRKTESELMLGALSTFLRVLDITPTADVAPVRHGHWDVREPMPMHDIKGNLSWGNWYVCTGCGFATTAIEGHITQYKYCPSCGARMDGEEKNCDTCKHHDKGWDDAICDGCTKAHSNWERRDDD